MSDFNYNNASSIEQHAYNMGKGDASHGHRPEKAPERFNKKCAAAYMSGVRDWIANNAT